MVLNKEKLFLVDPYNDLQIQTIITFEDENKIEKKISAELKKIQNNFSKKQYINQKESSNELAINLFLEKKGKIKDICSIQGEKDIKKCKITFVPIQSPTRKKMIKLATEYALEMLKMKLVFLDINPEDKLVISYLKSDGYENLGEAKGKIIFLKEKT